MVYTFKDGLSNIPDLAVASLHVALEEAKRRAKDWNRTIIVMDKINEWVVTPDQKVVKRK